jgi:ATP-dependent protease ClpP protease subunit
MTISARIVRQLSIFAGRVGIVAAIAMIAIGLSGGNARAIPNQDLPLVDSAIYEDGTLFISWSGPVVVGMSAYLHSVLEKHASEYRRIVLHLDSVGGDVEEGERAIAVLQEVKATHWLVTLVMHGDICASMCVPIYLQGSDRVAAPASLWLIHEVAILADDGKERMDRGETLRLFTRYYLPAGVSAQWLQSIFSVINGTNLWLTGQDLITLKTGIITHPLNNTTPRVASAQAEELG